jgi:hypothetical protein
MVAFPELFPSRVGQDLDGGALSRPVGTEEAEHLALMHAERGAVDGHHVLTMGLAQVLDHDDVFHRKCLLR